MNPDIVVSSKLYDVTLILFCRVCGVQLVMPKGAGTKGMVPPYPIALRWVPINGFTYDTASFLAARHENEHTVSKARGVANLFITGNCIVPAGAGAQLSDSSGKSQLPLMCASAHKKPKMNGRISQIRPFLKGVGFLKS